MYRWGLVGSLVYAPWAYGCTKPWTVAVLDAWMGGLLALWCVDCWRRREWPVLPWLLPGLAAFLIAQAWWMTANSSLNPTDPQPIRWLPGGVHRAASARAALHFTLVLGFVCLACDLGRRTLWRRRIWRAMAATGISIVCLGLAQRFAGAPGIFWRANEGAVGFFGPFSYHGNSATFINLVWPLAAGLYLVSLSRGSKQERAFWLVGVMLCLASIFVNTSRAGSFLALFLASFLSWAAGPAAT